MIKKIFIIFLLFFCISANAIEKKDNFSIEMLEKAQASGKTIVINSYEIWCGTCSAQTKVLNQAKKEFKEIVFLSYEQSKNKDIAQKLGIKYRTTIVVYKGNNEVSRIIGQTDKATIYSTIKKGI
jgi:thiol-disulfide isomerase/thioredoxin|tara:strand:+ start:520 stop:894 length:375 start_codon:yes stop_codon:yes gene_type:complete